jgi:hypothetical protein
MESTILAINTFRESYVTLSALTSDEPDEFAARRLRCEMARAAWENTKYRNIHPWAQAVRNRYGLYKYIRSIHDVTYQDTEFWVSVIWRGLLRADMKAGAVPLTVDEGTDDERVRAAAYKLLTDSNWNVEKSICTRLGALCGYVGIAVIDDIQRGQVRLEVVPPEAIQDVCIEHGVVKEYVLSYWRDNKNDVVTKYSQRVMRGDGDTVIYETFVNDVPSAWTETTDENGKPVDTWQEIYGFIPFSIIQHVNIGGTWGVAELQPALSKIQETDDLGGMLDDYIRKTINAPALISGIAKRDISTDTKEATVDRPQPGREEIKTIFSEKPGVTWQPMVMPMDITSARARIQDIIDGMKNEYPELQSMWETGGDASGKALRIKREPVEAKVIDRRVNYDAGLLSAIRMGIAIGGMRGYPGYEGFDLTSYGAGKLGINIAPRDVFPPDRADFLAEQGMFWQTWASVANTNVTFETFARSYGWTDAQIEEYEASQQKSFIPAEGL